MSQIPPQAKVQNSEFFQSVCYSVHHSVCCSISVLLVVLFIITT